MEIEFRIREKAGDVEWSEGRPDCSQENGSTVEP
jgi:hypothetical protein